MVTPPSAAAPSGPGCRGIGPAPSTTLPSAAGWPWTARMLMRLAVALAIREEARRRRPGDVTRLSPHLRRDVGLEG